MKCASFIHVSYHDFIMEVMKIFPFADEDKIVKETLKELGIPEGGDSASYFLANPNINKTNLWMRQFSTTNTDEYKCISSFFNEMFPAELGIFIDMN